MSTVVVTKQVEAQPVVQTFRRLIFPVALITAITPLALLVHGYHPYAEDGGLYAAGIKHLLNPALYPYSLHFVEEHLRFSLFAQAVAATVHLTHLNLEVVLLGVHLASIWLTVFAVWTLAQQCYSSQAAHAGATLLAAAWLTVPVAGTSLMLMDPYATARSVSLPCTLLALAAALNFSTAASLPEKLRSFTVCGLLLLISAVAHPLMAAYALGNVLLLTAITARSEFVKRWGALSLCLAAVALASILYFYPPADTAAYTRVALTRHYWFLSQWQWYEMIGLIAPLLILSAVAFPRAQNATDAQVARQALAKMAITTGITAALIALWFAHESSASHLVARLQPLRTLQTIYMLMILTLGATLGEHLLRRRIWLWVVTFTLFGGIFFFVQRNTYPSSAHIEWPGAAPSNGWQQAFLWIKENTPSSALFAMDANYISLPGEDAQSFRAIAERSALPDYSKDGGEASITPALTTAWVAGQQTQTNLSHMSDAERQALLSSAHANWIILQQQAQTSFDCPFQNALVKVCHLP